MRILMHRAARAASTATLIAVCSGGTTYADPIGFGVVGSAIDLSANVKESILPNGTLFQDSKPLFGTTPDPIQSAELLHLAARGVNGSGRSTTILGAFTSSLAESNGNGGVGVSQLLFGDPGAPGNVVDQLVAQSLWTQTFLYTGTPDVDLTLHLHIPALQVGLIGVAPQRTSPSATETAEASARVDTVITHADGSFSKGGSFEFGLREFERQLFLGPGHFSNFADIDPIGVGANLRLFDSLTFGGDDFEPSWSIDSVSTNVKLGTLQDGDILSYVYTLTSVGTTHGFEHGYFAFLGDPFGADQFGDNLTVTAAVTGVVEPEPGVPEPDPVPLMMLGLTGCAGWLHRRALHAVYARNPRKTLAARGFR